MSELEHAHPARIELGRKSRLYYGPSGTGKTTLALMHPGKHKFIIDVDNKIHEMENAAKQLEGVTVWPLDELLSPGGIVMPVIDPTRKDAKLGYDPSRPAPKGFQRVMDVTNELLRKEADFPFDCVILDSGTRLVDHLITAILHTHKMGSMTETLWGVFGSAWNNYLQGFLRLPCDRIVIFHDRHVTKRNRDGEIIEEFTRPSVYGASGMNIASYFSEVYFFLGRQIGGSNYLIQTAADAIKPARTTKNLDPFRQVIDPKVIYG